MKLRLSTVLLLLCAGAPETIARDERHGLQARYEAIKVLVDKYGSHFDPAAN